MRRGFLAAYVFFQKAFPVNRRNTVRVKHPGKEVVYCSSRLELNQELEQMVGEGDLLLTMGAGDVTTVGPEFIEYLTAKKDA